LFVFFCWFLIIVVDILFLGKTISRITDYSRRTQVSLIDIHMAFKELGIDLNVLRLFRESLLKMAVSFPYRVLTYILF
jgi:hypothetical protein